MDKKTLLCSVAALDHRRTCFLKNALTWALVIATAVKKQLGHSIRKRKIQRPGTTFSNLSDTAVAVLTGAKTAAALPHCIEST